MSFLLVAPRLQELLLLVVFALRDLFPLRAISAMLLSSRPVVVVPSTMTTDASHPCGAPLAVPARLLYWLIREDGVAETPGTESAMVDLLLLGCNEPLGIASGIVRLRTLLVD
jgi:hypothetical protein